MAYSLAKYGPYDKLADCVAALSAAAVTQFQIVTVDHGSNTLYYGVGYHA